MLSIALTLSPRPLQAENARPPVGHAFQVNGDHFELDGKPFQIISGSMEYSRVPRAYWRDRLRKARAMGLNTVEIYVFWNEHENSPGQFDFSGQRDVAEFIREAQLEGLFTILRPGPYVCAEWELGGFPAWLLRNPEMVFRSSAPAYIAAAGSWLKRLGQELAPLQIGNGGPIIAVQVENEYGSFGSDRAYLVQIRDLLLSSGFDRAMLYTADEPSSLDKGSLPELPAAVDFGGGDAKSAFSLLEKARPAGPRMCAEYWDGWFDHWGEKHHVMDAKQEAVELQWMLGKGYSVNLYMFHGGTSFGWMNGANSNGRDYQPDTTSYDYDAPVSESGELTPKFFLFRDVIRRATGKTPPPPPAPIPVQALSPIHLTQTATLWESLPKPVFSQQPLTMESVGQNYGYILYRTSIAHALKGDLKLEDLHSYAQVYLDGVLAGHLDRHLDQSILPLDIRHDGARLDILVEDTGRVSFGHQIQHEQAGITERVTLGGKAITGWSIYSLPMRDADALDYKSSECTGACFYRATFQVDQPADTFLDTRPLVKGDVWLNGQPLGRFWNIGPQFTLYVPGPLLKKGANEIAVFDLEGASDRHLSFLTHPLLDSPLHIFERRLRPFHTLIIYFILALVALIASIAAMKIKRRSHAQFRN
jgi:beta-galactosidase